MLQDAVRRDSRKQIAVVADFQMQITFDRQFVVLKHFCAQSQNKWTNSQCGT